MTGILDDDCVVLARVDSNYKSAGKSSLLGSRDYAGHVDSADVGIRLETSSAHDPNQTRPKH